MSKVYNKMIEVCINLGNFTTLDNIIRYYLMQSDNIKILDNFKS